MPWSDAVRGDGAPSPGLQRRGGSRMSGRVSSTESAPEYFIGLLSGTSMDGIDAALVRFQPTPAVVETHFVAFPEALRQEMLALCVPGPGEIDRLGRVDVALGRLFAEAANALMVKAGIAPTQVRAIGSHGQTIRHRPGFDPAFTLQIGDPNVIAALTGVPVAADFRRKDMALGGQGAPLVPAFHDAIFRQPGRDRVVINIGGIANITVLPAAPTAPVLGFDTGPGNTLLDAWCRRVKGEPMDRGGRFAASGHVVAGLLRAMLAEPYFAKLPPKSTGPEQFSMAWLDGVLGRWAAFGQPSEADVQATLLALTARSIADAIRRLGLTAPDLFVCGGGAHNVALMIALQAELPDSTLERTDALGVASDWVEAMAFAWLAQERVYERPANCPVVTGASRRAVLGGLFLPA